MISSPYTMVSGSTPTHGQWKFASLVIIIVIIIILMIVINKSLLIVLIILSGVPSVGSVSQWVSRGSFWWDLVIPAWSRWDFLEIFFFWQFLLFFGSFSWELVIPLWGRSDFYETLFWQFFGHFFEELLMRPCDSSLKQVRKLKVDYLALLNSSE